MKSASPPYPQTWSPAWTRVADYLELTKPRIAVLVLFTVAIGGLLATRDVANLPALVHTIIGTALVAAAASALNQLWERHTDALMHRTENRPLPAGRLTPAEVFVFGIGLAAAGFFYLAFTVGRPLCVLLAAVTFFSYVCVYTPLKRHTTLNTLIGAVPGALPPLIGWSATGEPLELWSIVLFLLLFFWQIPHFLAIAWIHRADYARAQLRMLPVADTAGRRTAGRMLAFCVILTASSLVPVFFGTAGWLYAAGALALGFVFLAAIIGFTRHATAAAARRVLHASLVYLPAICLVLLLQNLL